MLEDHTLLFSLSCVALPLVTGAKPMLESYDSCELGNQRTCGTQRWRDEENVLPSENNSERKERIENPMLNKGRVIGPAVWCSIASLSLLTTSTAAADNSKETERVEESGTVMSELLNSASGVPISVLNKAECVIVLPSTKKAGFIVGASYGRGVMTCRGGEDYSGPWSAPTMMQSTGASFGLQAGGQATDFVVLVMNDRGAKDLLNGKVKLGGDASVAAGPVGRDAEASTNAKMTAEMLSYSRARGVFAGVSLAGSTLGPDNSANEDLYGKKVTATEIVKGGSVTAPDSAAKLIDTLTKASPKNVSAGKS
jgi:SH3 domain-containing YSC84-like protein 1